MTFQANLYDVRGEPSHYLYNEEHNSYVNFKMGGIPTGVAEVGADPDWYADCYTLIPGEKNWSRKIHKYLPANEQYSIAALLSVIAREEGEALVDLMDTVLSFTTAGWFK